MLVEKYAQEIQAILAKYQAVNSTATAENRQAEQRRSAVMPLLYLAQRDKMYIDRKDMAEIAQILGMTSTEVATIVGFYSLYYDKPGGRYRIQVCNICPALCAALKSFWRRCVLAWGSSPEKLPPMA